VAAGSPDLPMTVTGTGFAYGAEIRWGGIPLPTTYHSSNQLSATVPSAVLGAPTSWLVTVFNPGPGGGISNSQQCSRPAVRRSP
jgi:hypothetical protein